MNRSDQLLATLISSQPNDDDDDDDDDDDAAAGDAIHEAIMHTPIGGGNNIVRIKWRHSHSVT